MDNNQTSANPNPNLHFLNDRSFDFSNFSPSSQSNHCINNDQHNDLCHEGLSLDLASTKSFDSGKNPLFEV